VGPYDVVAWWLEKSPKLQPCLTASVACARELWHRMHDGGGFAGLRAAQACAQDGLRILQRRVQKLAGFVLDDGHAKQLSNR
jgi:hypothetical protein